MAELYEFPIVKPRRRAVYQVEVGTYEDFLQIVEPGGLADQFWPECGLSDITEVDLDRFREAAAPAVKAGNLNLILGLADGEPVGFMMFDLSRFYTKAPLAHVFILYVHPKHRLSRLGRMLIETACATAKLEGACAFYAGAMAELSPIEDKRFMNMLRKCGFEHIGGFARRVL